MILAAAKAAIAPYALMIKLAALAALVVGAVAFVQHHDAQTREQADAAGYNRRVAEEVQASVAAAMDTSRRDAQAVQATRHFRDQLNAQMPQIEETTYAREENVRVVYRDHPVPAQCVRPAGVLQQLEAARASANAAAGATAR